LTSISLLI